MRTGIALALALGISTVAASVSADDDISNQFTVAATLKAGKVDIVIKPANDKVFVNADFPIKIHVDPKEGGTVDKTDLTKADGTYEKSEHEGKAKSVTFHVTANKGLKGEGRIVICSTAACGNPTKFTFESH